MMYKFKKVLTVGANSDIGVSTIKVFKKLFGEQPLIII